MKIEVSNTEGLRIRSEVTTSRVSDATVTLLNEGVSQKDISVSQVGDLMTLIRVNDKVVWYCRWTEVFGCWTLETSLIERRHDPVDIDYAISCVLDSWDGQRVRRIPAIKAYREKTKESLLHSKLAIETAALQVGKVWW
tara:strand:- start:161 stop:577 length:417 start_codon:yes stop_codon:yes gene_type:complete